MVSQLFKVGGGAGIGSYIIVVKDKHLLKVSAEKIRASYDNGENLFLSILDDSTQEALLPLTGYVDNDNILHLSGRDFDDELTYEITIDNSVQEAALEIVDGVTMGDGVIGEGGGSAEPYELKDYVLDLDEEIFSCSDEDAEYIFKNNPTAILMDGIVAVAKEFSNDDSKQEYSRGYWFYEYYSDTAIIIYEIGIDFNGESEEYDFDLKYSDPIGGGEELTYATDEEIAALFNQPGPQPTYWNVTYNLTGCWQGSGATGQVQDGGLLQFQLNPNYNDYEWQSVVITMGGTDITSAAWDEGNREVLIRNVTGEVVITAVCIEVQPATTYNFSYNAEGCLLNTASPNPPVEGQSFSFSFDPDGLPIMWYLNSITMDSVDISNDPRLTWNEDGTGTISSVDGDIYINIECDVEDEPEPEEWSVTYEDMNASFSSQPDSVAEGDPLNITISPGNDPWVHKDCTVEMGGLDITAEVVTESGNNYIISIPSVDADVTIYVQYEDEEDPGYDWEISYNGNCEATDTSSGEEAPMGVYDYESLDVTLSPDDPEAEVDMMASSIFVTMGGDTIDSDPTKCTIYESGDTYRVVIPQVNGDVVISVNFAYEYPEDEVPIESIRYTDGQGNTCIGFNMDEGTSCDLWDHLEITPIDYTDGVDFSSSDDAVIQVDGGGIVTAVGGLGESATVTISSMEDSSVYTTVSISISDPDEPDEPEEEEE